MSTTTTTFQGRDSERNSSRVMHPPGGGSSINFAAATPAESAHQAKSNQTSSHIFGDPYDADRDVRRSDQKKAAERDQRKQEFGQFETPKYVKAEKPQEDTQSKLFGDDNSQARRGRGQGEEFPAYDSSVYAAQLGPQRRNNQRGEEFPAYDSSVYAAQLTPQKRNTQRASSYNPITGETYSGFEDEPETSHHTGKRKGGQNIGSYNPITGEDYSTQREASNGDGPEQPMRTSSKVLAPPGGKSSGIF